MLAILAFVVGNALAFALEALVAGVQALRLEYYELFSRIFAGEGHALRALAHPAGLPNGGSMEALIWTAPVVAAVAVAHRRRLCGARRAAGSSASSP